MFYGYDEHMIHIMTFCVATVIMVVISTFNSTDKKSFGSSSSLVY